MSPSPAGVRFDRLADTANSVSGGPPGQRAPQASRYAAGARVDPLDLDTSWTSGEPMAQGLAHGFLRAPRREIPHVSTFV